VRTFKSTLAAVTAYVVALPFSDNPRPVLAPLTALLVVQLTLYETVRRGCRGFRRDQFEVGSSIFLNGNVLKSETRHRVEDFSPRVRFGNIHRNGNSKVTQHGRRLGAA